MPNDRTTPPGAIIDTRADVRAFFTDLHALCKEYGIATLRIDNLHATEGLHPDVRGALVLGGAPKPADAAGYVNIVVDMRTSPTPAAVGVEPMRAGAVPAIFTTRADKT